MVKFLLKQKSSVFTAHYGTKHCILCIISCVHVDRITFFNEEITCWLSSGPLSTTPPLAQLLIVLLSVMFDANCRLVLFCFVCCFNIFLPKSGSRY